MHSSLDTDDRAIDVTRIPSFQLLAMKVARAANDDNVSVNQLADMISQDIGLASRMLKVANSVIYTAAQGKTVSIREAINRVGMKETRNICVAVATKDFFCDNTENAEFIEQFKHSLSVANICELIAGYCTPEIAKSLSRDTLYISGLLHDIGLVIVYLQQPELFKLIASNRVNNHREFTLLETKTLGYTHAEVSSLALRHWGFPEEIAEITKYHHCHENAPEKYQAYTKILHISDMIATQYGYSDHIGDIIVPFDVSAWHDLGLKDKDVPAIIKETDARVEKTELFASLSAK